MKLIEFSYRVLSNHWETPVKRSSNSAIFLAVVLTICNSLVGPSVNAADKPHFRDLLC